MENYLSISFLNDFIFCPRSIYFHQLYSNFDDSTYHEDIQRKGRIAHKTIDDKKYSTRKEILQGLYVYSNEFSVCGRIDLFDVKKGLLTERKRKVHKIYDGFIFQVYAQYYCLIEMGYHVWQICIYSLEDNKKYNISLPKDDLEMDSKFKNLIDQIKCFDLEEKFKPNVLKCNKCIYKNLCDYSPVL